MHKPNPAIAHAGWPAIRIAGKVGPAGDDRKGRELMNRMSYQLYEMSHLALAPSRAISDVARLIFKIR